MCAAGFYSQERNRKKRPSLVETGLCAPAIDCQLGRIVRATRSDEHHRQFHNLPFSVCMLSMYDSGPCSLMQHLCNEPLPCMQTLACFLMVGPWCTGVRGSRG